MIKFDEIIKSLFEQEEIFRTTFSNDLIKAILHHKQNFYFGQIIELKPEYSREIVAINIYRKPLAYEIYQEIKRLDENRLDIIAHPSLDIHNPSLISRLVNNELTELTQEQINYLSQESLPKKVLRN
jgi:hypothetical protein